MKEILSDDGNHLNKPVGLGLNSGYAAGTKGIWCKNKMAMKDSKYRKKKHGWIAR